MNVDGYIRVAIDPTGQKNWVIDYETNNMQLKWHFSNFMGEDANDLIDMNEVEKINSDIKNSLLLVTFSHRSVSSFNGETTDYDEDTTVRDVIVLDTDYKETWRKNLTTMYGSCTKVELEENRCKEDIAEWEEFYDEDFEFFQPKSASLLQLESLFK